jgi:hypothetical protein
LFGPDETASNKLTAIYAGSKKTWLDNQIARLTQKRLIASDFNESEGCPATFSPRSISIFGFIFGVQSR